MSEAPVLFLCGFLAGMLGGLLGIGGGIVLMPFLRFVVGLSPGYSAGICVLGVFFTTLGGSFRHHRMGHVLIRPLVPVIVAGVVASFAFSFLFMHLARHETWFDFGIGLVFVLISTRMIFEGLRKTTFRKPEESDYHAIEGPLTGKMTIGGIAGILPGLLGIGTGVILVPTFHYLLDASIKAAMAASLTCFCLNALVSSAVKFSQGYILLSVALPICAGAFLGANAGALLNNRVRAKGVKLFFGLVFMYISLKFIFSSLGVKI